jgi:hypothetical protein
MLNYTVLISCKPVVFITFNNFYIYFIGKKTKQKMNIKDKCVFFYNSIRQIYIYTNIGTKSEYSQDAVHQ